jgi:predicted NAD/FAD-binding protein
VVAKISNKFSNVYCNLSVSSIYPKQGKVVVVDDTGKEFVFDHVIVATQANHASKTLKCKVFYKFINFIIENLLSKSPRALLNILNGFEYETGSIYIHTDKNIMPKVITRYWISSKVTYS